MNPDDRKRERRENRLEWIASRCRGRVLDIGCSRSLLGLRVVARDLPYVGLDLDRAALDDTRAAIAALPEDQRALATLHETRFEDHAVKGPFDTLVLAEILEHQSDPASFLASAVALLAPGGQVLVTTPFGWMPDPTHEQAPFVSDHLAWLEAAKLFPHEIEVGDYHVRVRAEATAGAPVDYADVLRQTEREAEAVQRFWIGERDRQADRVATLIERTQTLLAQRTELARKVEALRAATAKGLVERGRRALGRVRRNFFA